jgi:DNA-binding Lrp family transcriptional regulator
MQLEDVAPQDLPPSARPPGDRTLASSVDAAERAAIEAALREFDGNRERAAELLGLSPTTLWRKMKRLKSSGRAERASMKIRRLELQGFKSFVDRTVLTFDHDVTAVVGPNGCGKSNTVDAIRWCMGEQSARTSAASSMEDVIFNGSDNPTPRPSPR